MIVRFVRLVPTLGKNEQGYSPRFPWKWIGLVLVGVVASVVAWNWQSGSRLESRRQALLDAHAELSPARERHDQFRERLEALILAAATEDPGDEADERLRLSELHQGDGLYLRIPREMAGDSASLSEAVRAMSSDAITRCLGIAPTSLRGFYEIAEFLGENFSRRIRDAQTELVLSGLENEMTRRTAQDVAASSSAFGADYLLVVLEHGESRSEHPVDVFLWRLSSGGDERVLSARMTSRGMLVPARIALPGVETNRAQPLAGVADRGRLQHRVSAQGTHGRTHRGLRVRGGSLAG